MYQSLKISSLLIVSIFAISSCIKENIDPSAPSNPSTVPSVQVSQYTLDYSNSIGVPVSNPTGIASDGTNLWIMSGEHNGDQHELTLYNPTTYTIIRQFSYTNLIEALGTGVYGITWDGSNVWISVSGNTNKLVKVDPENGDILQTWSSPTHLGPSDLEWDGDKIWIASGTGQIHTMNSTNGGSQLILDNVGASSRDSGIAFRNGELWVGNLFNNDVDIYSAQDGSHQGIIQNALTTEGKLCFHNGQLMVLSSGGIAFYDVVQ